MMLTKRKDHVHSLTDVRFWIALNKLKLPNLGKLDNLIRIVKSDLSWQKRIEWAKRISSYKGSRQETLEYYTVLYNSAVLAKQKMIEKSSKVMGDKNPWSKHGGKYSPFKIGSINYSEDVVIKANENRDYNTRISYYTKRGIGLCHAIAAIKERQAVGRLDKYIERHGEEIGNRKWKERQEKWQNTLDSKTIEEKARINSSKNSNGYSISKAEKEIFNALASYLPDIRRALVLFYNEGKNYYVYDIAANRRIIEYNGDFWHANPKIYDESFINKVSKRNAIEIWNKEKHKEEIAISNGYTIHRVWESDYGKDKKKVIEECLNFLTK